MTGRPAEHMSNMSPTVEHRHGFGPLEEDDISSRWASISVLLLAPTACAIFGVLFSPLYFTLAFVFIVVAARPLRYLIVSRTPMDGCPCRIPKMGIAHSSSYAATAAANEVIDLNKAQLDSLVHKSFLTQRSVALNSIIMVVFFFLYRLTAFSYYSAGERESNDVIQSAYENACTIVSIEDALGIGLEPTIQSWFVPHTWLTTTGFFYDQTMHFIVPLAVFMWVMITGRDKRYEHRVSFAIMLLIAFLGYAMVPTMPPRLLGRYWHHYILDKEMSTDEDERLMEQYWKMVDVTSEGGAIATIYSTFSPFFKGWENPYATMPSMHTGWAVWSVFVVLQAFCQVEMISTDETEGGDLNNLDQVRITPSLARNASYGEAESSSLLKRRVLIWLMSVHVFITLLFTIITADHFILDALVGAGCALIGRGMSRLLTSDSMLDTFITWTLKVTSPCRDNYTTIEDATDSTPQIRLQVV